MAIKHFFKYIDLQMNDVFQKKGSDLVVQYIGTIDDNYQDPKKVSTPYLANALDAVIAGKSPEPSTTRAIGCGIKVKSK